MPDIMQIHVEGLEVLLDRMQEIGAGRFIPAALKAVGQSIRKEAGDYPPVPAPRNPPAHYERKRGWWSASGKLYEISENMKAKWYVHPEQWAVLIGNTASYSPYVHGEDQTQLHAEHGWKKLANTAEAALPELLDKLGDQIERIWSRP